MSDLISRQDAIKMVCNAVCEYDVSHYPDCDQIKYCDEIQALISLPSAGQNCILCEYYTEIETDDGIKGKCTIRTGSDLISRQWLLDLYGKYIDGDVEEGKALFVPLEVVRQNIKDAPSADRPKDEVYNYLKERIGDIVDDMKEFDAWFERMVWHVKECDRIAKSADRPTGEWKQVGLLADRLCSVCGYGVWDFEAEEYNYCPNCGAKMEGMADV